MYNIKCEMTLVDLLLFLAGPIILIFGYSHIGSVEIYSMIFLYVMILFTIVKKLIRYFSLKKNGNIIDNLPYFVETRNNENFMYVNYTNKAGEIVKLYKRKKTGESFSNLPENGITSIIINPNNEKHYYIFYPSNKSF